MVKVDAAPKLASPDCGWPVMPGYPIPSREPSDAAGATTSGNAAAPFWMGHRHRTPAVETKARRPGFGSGSVHGLAVPRRGGCFGRIGGG